MQRRKTGRPSKGDRVLIGCRVPRHFREALVAAAAQRGMTVNDLIGETLAEVIDVPYHAGQEVLQLQNAS